MLLVQPVLRISLTACFLEGNTFRVCLVITGTFLIESVYRAGRFMSCSPSWIRNGIDSKGYSAKNLIIL